MQMPDKDHPIWSILRLIIVGIVLVTILALGYDNAFDWVKDIRTVFITLAGLGSFDMAKKALI